MSFCNIFIDIHYIVIHMAKIKKITKDMDSVSDISSNICLGALNEKCYMYSYVEQSNIIFIFRSNQIQPTDQFYN